MAMRAETNARARLEACSRSGMTSGDLQRWMHERSGVKVTTVAASHDVYISHPKIVAGVIEDVSRRGVRAPIGGLTL